MKFHSLKQRFEPYADVLIFVITLLVANLFWKFTFVGDEHGETVTWFGMDVTAPFEWMACHIAEMVYRIVSLFRDTVHLINLRTIRFDSGSGTMIVWGCTGLKQAFIWFWLIFTVRGGWKQKIWFIPLGWICCYAFNIFRLVLLALFIEFHPDWFYFLHDILFKYLFYGMLFGLWVWFVETIRPSVSPR